MALSVLATTVLYWRTDMNRYCPKCQKEFDFQIRSSSDLDNLVCPECGGKIDRNSRKPFDSSSRDKTETAIGMAFFTLTRINYFFFSAVSAIGIVAFFLHWDKALYITTGICLALFLFQLIKGTLFFRTGPFFIPLGAVAGYFLFKSIRGACLGVCIVFVARNLLWNLFFWILGKITRV